MADLVLVAAVVLVLILVYVGVALIRRYPGELKSSDRTGGGPTEGTPPASGSVPRAMDHIEEIRARLGSPAMVFLDYDGTLTPIVDDPSRATIGNTERSVLGALAQRLPVAIVSGRGMEDVKRLVAVQGLTYAGSHGFEIELPDGETFEHPDAGRLAVEIDRAHRRLVEDAGGLDGVFVERKPFAIALHTRRAKSDQVRDRVRDLAERVAAQFDALAVAGGKEIHEIRPALDWHKGRAVEHVLRKLPGDPRPLYIGDDETDEDAFRIVRVLGGVAVLVGPSTGTSADYTLADPGETIEFLTRLAVD